jgi:hypothetical protein
MVAQRKWIPEWGAVLRVGERALKSTRQWLRVTSKTLQAQVDVSVILADCED